MKIKEKTKLHILTVLQFIIMISMFVLLYVYNVTTVSTENTIMAGCIMLPTAILVMSVWIVGDRIS